jgi:hypothetical protein
MKRISRSWKTVIVGVVTLLALTGCLVGGYGGGGGVDVGYAGGFYEPGGYEYGGWGRGYRVGPPRGGVRGEVRGDRGGRSAPSIPHGARGGGGGRR